MRLYSEPQLPNKANIEAPDQSWSALPKPLDTNSMLAQVLNIMETDSTTCIFYTASQALTLMARA
jgi:hypothetical protein